MSIDRQPHDLAVVHLAPQDPTEIRVVTAEELSLQNRVAFLKQKEHRPATWTNPPSILVNPPRSIQIDGAIESAIYKEHPIEISGLIELPSLPYTEVVAAKDEVVQVVILTCEVGAAHDPTLGQFSIQFINSVDETTGTAEVENTRRLRHFWMIVASDMELDENAFWDALSVDANGDKVIGITPEAIGNTGMAWSSHQVYAFDMNWTVGEYKVIEGSIEVAPLCLVRRWQNYTLNGYIWGNGGEEPFSYDFNIKPTYRQRLKGTIQSKADQRVAELFGDEHSSYSCYSHAIVNLIAGASSYPDFPGIPATSPNNSFAIANDQRVSFVNQTPMVAQERPHPFSIQQVFTSNDNGVAVATATLNTNSPPGSAFSQDNNHHRVYRLDGTEIGQLGNFVRSQAGVGAGASLSWYSNGANANVDPGDMVIIMPSIHYPAGSGFSIPLQAVEKAWLNGVEISSQNIRDAAVDALETYEAPANGEDFLIFYTRDRAGICYILKKVTVTANADGVLKVPPNALGAFAFVNSVMGLINAPFVSGLDPSQNYEVLIYYPPIALGEEWQFQLKFQPYQGLREFGDLQGAMIVSIPKAYLHTQGGGVSVVRGEGRLQYSPIAMHLPMNINAGVKAYDLDHPVQQWGIPYPGPDTFSEVELIPGTELTLPRLGATIDFVPSGSNQPRTLAGQLVDAKGRVMGARIPAMNTPDAPYQYVVTFLVEKMGVQRLVVCTYNGYSSNNVPFDSRNGTAIDLFYL